MRDSFDNFIPEHDVFKFRVPGDLEVTDTNIRRVLLIGVCTASHIAPRFAEIFNAECDYVHIGTLGDQSAMPPRRIDEYDFQIVILPLDYVMPAHLYFKMNYNDSSSERSRFEASKDEMLRLLHNGLKWTREAGIPTFVGNFLTPQQNPVGRFLPRYDLRNPRFFVESLNRVLTEEVEDHQNAYLLDMDGIVATFGKKYLQDDFVWSDSHGALLSDLEFVQFETQRAETAQRLEPLGPLSHYYTTHVESCYRAVCEEIRSMYRSVRQYDSVKLVVIDLDDTAWRGVAAEQDQDQDFLTVGWPLGFVEALMYLKRRGIILAIISKNDHEKTSRKWENIYGAFFPLSNFASIKINWNSKVDNMSEILQETNLLPKNVLYIDDNPVERNAIEANFTQLRVIGSNPYYFRRILLWSAELQSVFITEESARRTEMVQSQIERETIRRKMTNEEFLVSLGVKIAPHVIDSVDNPRFPRFFELLNKTNQFNTTGQRWTLEDLVQKFASGLKAYTFDTQDKFTHYGIVCVALVMGNVIEQLAMSCRVIGLGVELSALSVIENDMHKIGIEEFIGINIDTNANILSRSLFRNAIYIEKDGVWVKRSLPLQLPPHVCLIRA